MGGSRRVRAKTLAFLASLAVVYLNKLNSEGGLADASAAEDDNLVLSHPRVDGPGRRSGRFSL